MPRHIAISDNEIAQRMEALVNASNNRYRVTVQVAMRAKRRRFEALDDDESTIKPVIQAVVEMSDELTEPEILPDTNL